MLVSASLSARAQFDAGRTICRQVARWQQDGVNHIGETGGRYGPLTSEIKPIPMPLWHAPRNVRALEKQVRQGAICEASNRARLSRVEPHCAARPPRSARP